nr:MAG TPA: hypothetical protein [Caudoviricetes sp.]
MKVAPVQQYTGSRQKIAVNCSFKCDIMYL